MQAAHSNPQADFDPQPVLRGPSLLLRPLVAADREALWEVARDRLLWALHPDQTRFESAGFERFFQGSLESGSALVVVDQHTGRIVGSSRYYDWEPAKRELAIGYTFLARDCWGGDVNRELKHLMIEHAAPWADRIWFHVGKGNLRSRRAMEKMGARAEFEGLRPQNGEMIDFIYYALDVSPWLAAQGALNGRD
ncbi:MAG: GNAT family N-acetyltransferase [Gammaproteobacteria bacterium]|nr:GNAT family N-acetyltransferase [Gammaproteobacteria bacterium]